MAKAAKTHPAALCLIRPGQLARLLDVDHSTIWRWAKNGVLPPPRQIGPAVHGWPEDEIAQLIERRRRAPAPAPVSKPPTSTPVVRMTRIMPRVKVAK